MEPLVAILVALGALLLGLLLGWVAGGRGAAVLRAEAPLRADELRRAADRAQAAERLLAVAEERAGQAELLRRTLDAVTGERDEAKLALAAERNGATERERGFGERLAELKEAKDLLARQFGEIGGKLLDEAQRAFLDRANERFVAAGDANELRLKALLTPVESTLKRYDEKLGEIERARAGAYGELKEAVAQLSSGNEKVRTETARLANVLRSSPKARGRWGEEQLRTILEQAGLAENVDFTLQSSVADGERQLRPDCVINLPGGRCIVVDVKCPLVHFEQAFDEEDEGRRAALLLSHAGAMKAYAADLGRKGYWRQFDLSPDFVIMFIPGEHFLSAAAERAPDLIETAFRSGVIIASTINMLALAKVMAGMWRQETIAQQAKEIADVGKEMYRRVATLADHVAKLGRNLSQANGAYNAMVGSLESQVLTQAKRFEALKVETGGKSIEPLPLVETSVRPLTKLPTGAAAQAAE